MSATTIQLSEEARYRLSLLQAELRRAGYNGGRRVTAEAALMMLLDTYAAAAEDRRTG